MKAAAVKVDQKDGQKAVLAIVPGMDLGIVQRVVLVDAQILNGLIENLKVNLSGAVNQKAGALVGIPSLLEISSLRKNDLFLKAAITGHSIKARLNQ